MKIVLIDDHPVVRRGLKALLEGNRQYRVVGEASNGAEAIALIRDRKPQVAVLDIKLPDMSGFQVASETKQQSPETRIIMLSMHADEFHVDEAFRSGADGYVVKDAMEQEIVDAIRAVTAGERYVSGILARSTSCDPDGPGQAGKKDPYHTLTSREREILCLIAQGNQNKEIAERLYISLRTVETHRANIMRKLELRTHAELILFAVRKKLICLP